MAGGGIPPSLLAACIESPAGSVVSAVTGSAPTIAAPVAAVTVIRAAVGTIGRNGTQNSECHDASSYAKPAAMATANFLNQ